MLRPSPRGTSDAPTTSAGSDSASRSSDGQLDSASGRSEEISRARRVVPTATKVSGATSARAITIMPTTTWPGPVRPLGRSMPRSGVANAR